MPAQALPRSESHGLVRTDGVANHQAQRRLESHVLHPVVVLGDAAEHDEVQVFCCVLRVGETVARRTDAQRERVLTLLAHAAFDDARHAFNIQIGLMHGQRARISWLVTRR